VFSRVSGFVPILFPSKTGRKLRRKRGVEKTEVTLATKISGRLEVKMKRYKVTGCIDVAVTTIVEIEDGEELTEEEICARAYDVFEGVGSYAGFGDCNHLIGVSGNEKTIEATSEVEFTECEEE